MLTLIMGDAGSGKTTRLVSAIQDDIKQGISSYLIVPEQKTVTAERHMADLLPSSSCLTFEVTNFTRLCDTIFRLCGGLAGDVCDPVAEQLLMWRTMSELAPMLTTIRHRPDAAAVLKMRACIKELHSHRLTPALLQLAAANITDEALANKVRDYALIWSTYTALIDEHYTNSQDRLDKATELLKANKPFAGYHIYIDDFSSYTEQELAIMEALLESCDLTVTLCLPNQPEKQLCADEVLLTRERLVHLASACGTSLVKIETGDNHRNLCPPIRFALENLWRIDYSSIPPYEGDADENLTLVEAPDQTDACHYIAADILRRVQAQGARFADFAIVCGSTSSYVGVLDVVLERNGIPFFFSRPADITALEPLKAIFSAYSIICRGWQKEDVIAYLKCGMSGVTNSACDEVELYAETWNIQGKRWYDGTTWTMSPDGYGTPHTEGRRSYLDEALERINEARALFVPPLHALAQRVKEETSVTAHIQALTEFLLAIDMPTQLEVKAKEKQNPLAQSYGQLWDVLCDALDTMHKLLSDVTITAEDFSAILKMLLLAKDLEHLPAHVDEVTVGQASLLRSESVKHVYLLGANEGEFPGVAKDDGAFTEQEREMLSQAGAMTADSLDIRAARELFAFRRAMALTEETLTVLWSRTTTLGTGSPSDAVLRLRTLLGSEYPVTYLDERHLPDLIWSYGVALERLGQCMGTETGEALRAVLADSFTYKGAVEALSTPICNRRQSLSPEVAQLLYPGDLAITQSRISSFLKCPFSYFCNYTLHLGEDKKGEFDSSNIGTFIHALLEDFFALARKLGKDIHALDEATQEQLLHAITDRVIANTLPQQELDNPRTKFLLNSLIAKTKVILASMCEELSHSQFEPAFFELQINNHNPQAPAPVTFTAEDGSHVYVYGTIDRVDKLVLDGNVYVRVVDYKTGIAQITQDAVRDGEAVQMPLYLFSLLGSDTPAFRERLGIDEGGKILPAGVMYLSSLTKEGATSTAITTEEEATAHAKKQIVRSGLFLYDEEVLRAMDDTPERSYIHVKPAMDKKTGELRYNEAARKRLLTQEEFDGLLQDMGQVLTDIAMRIKHGDATASPLHTGGFRSTCERCSYKPICRHVSRPKEDESTEDEE